MRIGLPMISTMAAFSAVLWSAGGSATTLAPPERAPTSVNLPLDFKPRFQSVCMRRGLPEARCACMVDVVLREVADEHLALMLDYFENPEGFDNRALQELDNDESRMNVLEEEIASAQATARRECQVR